MKKIHYTKQSGKWPYRLTVPHVEDTGIKLPNRIITDYMHIDRGGGLYITDGYSWDGPSGPAIDTEDFMRGSLVHDALYQLIRNGHLGKKWRKPADKIMKRICREDGMPWWRAGMPIGLCACLVAAQLRNASAACQHQKAHEPKTT